jgi:signal transduction histidine kinase
MALPDEARNVMRQRARSYLLPLLIAGVLMLASLAFLVRSVRIERSMAYMKNELVAKAAHNIKTPLGLLRVYIDALQAGEIVDKTQERKYLAVLKRECDRLCAITENLLSFSQLTMSREDREPFARDVIDLSKVVTRIADVFQDAGIAVQSDGSGEVLIAAQEAEVETAIYNLMDNARKYSSPGSSIHMTLAVHGTTANLAIRDHGIGFAPKDLANLGAPFYRGDTETVRRNKGLGLGLAVAVQIVERYGGRLTAAPGDGGGSVVRIVFPLHRKDGVKS